MSDFSLSLHALCFIVWVRLFRSSIRSLSIFPPFFQVAVSLLITSQPKKSIIRMVVSNECTPRPVVKVWYSYDPPFVRYEVFFFSTPSGLTETISILWVWGLRLPCCSGCFRFDYLSRDFQAAARCACQVESPLQSLPGSRTLLSPGLIFAVWIPRARFLLWWLLTRFWTNLY